MSILSRGIVKAVGLATLLCGMAAAETTTIYTISTGTGNTVLGNAVNSQAVIEVSNNKIHVVLTNLLNNPSSLYQALGFLFFQVDNGTTAGTLSSSSAIKRDILGNGTYTDSGTVSTGWKLTSSGSQMELCGVGCGSGTGNTLVGGPNYSGTGSISTFAHNPYLAGNAVFDLAVTGVTYQSKITNVSFGYSNYSGYLASGSNYTSRVVPEPSAYVLLGTCVGLIGYLNRRKLRRG